MEEFWVLILVAFFATNALDKTESVQLEETPHNPIDEIFGEGWWDNEKGEEWNKLTLEQNFNHQNDRQNTQIGQIETNSTDQNPPLTESDHPGQIEANSTDQNPPIPESDHSGHIEPNSTDQLGQIEPNSTDQIIKEMTSNAEDEQKRKIVAKFHAIRNEFKQKGKYSAKEWTQIENEITKHLKVSRSKIYKWKKEFGLSRKVFKEKEERKHLVEKFDQMKAELTRAGFKNSYHNEINGIVAKKLGLGFITIYNWKSELGQTKPNIHSLSEKKELMKRYYAIKDQNPIISDKDIAKMIKIDASTLCSWKKQFKQQQLHPNSVDENSVEENAAANVQDSGKN